MKRIGVTVQFGLLATAWGASFLFLKVGLEGLTPPQVVVGRLVTGAVTLAAISLVTRQRLPRDLAVWGHLSVVAALLCVAPYLLFAYAETQVSSGLASIYNATTPLMTILVAIVALPGERPGRSKIAGLTVGFAGVLVVLGPWRGLSGGSPLGQGACLLATFCYGIAFVYLRRFVSPRGLGAVPVATVQVGLAALIMLLLSPFTAIAPTHLSVPVVLSVGALGIIGTGFAFVWNTNVVAQWGAANASAVTYLTPIVGVALGVSVLGEGVAWNEPLGAALVVTGIAVSQQRLRLSRLRDAVRFPAWICMVVGSRRVRPNPKASTVEVGPRGDRAGSASEPVTPSAPTRKRASAAARWTPASPGRGRGWPHSVRTAASRPSRRPRSTSELGGDQPRR